ncbi:MAG: hypothetical protein Q8P90_01900 [bacterium]|nr:hypothetical protein [bacterium]
MTIPDFRRPPTKRELRDFSQAVPEWAVKRQEQADVMVSIFDEIAELEKTDPEAAEKMRKDYLPPEQMLENFYGRVAEDYKELPLEDDEIEQLFSAEHLASLSLEEYVELLRRVPPRFMTHITRQGVRDNASHNRGGYGEMNRGFEGALAV